MHKLPTATPKQKEVTGSGSAPLRCVLALLLSIGHGRQLLSYHHQLNKWSQQHSYQYTCKDIDPLPCCHSCLSPPPILRLQLHTIPT